MPAYIPGIFRYVQADASDTWVIEHNLAVNGSTGIPIVDVYVTIGGSTQKVVPVSNTINSPNQVTLVFNQPQVGEAIVIA
jgi:hypothetical protein